VGGACQAMADGKTKTETLHKPHDLKPPAHLYPDSQPCARKTFSASFVPQPTENHTSHLPTRTFTMFVTTPFNPRINVKAVK